MAHKAPLGVSVVVKTVVVKVTRLFSLVLVSFSSPKSNDKPVEPSFYSHSIVLVNLNEFSSIFRKVQHSYSRH